MVLQFVAALKSPPPSQGFLKIALRKTEEKKEMADTLEQRKKRRKREDSKKSREVYSSQQVEDFFNEVKEGDKR